MNKAFKFRIYPNEEQLILIVKTFGCVRFVYNKMLEAKKLYYEETGKTLYCYPSRFKTEFPWLREADSLALSNAQLNLNTAYKNFFRDKSMGFPKFKSKNRGDDAYTTNLVNRNIILENGYLRLPKLGKVKIKQHRSISEGYKLKSVTVSRAPTGKYFASILYEYEIEAKEVKPVNVLGLDFSMKELYVSSEGDVSNYPRYYKKSQTKLSKEQRKLSRKKKDGSNYRKQKRKQPLSMNVSPIKEKTFCISKAGG
jgi:putative transposase